MTAAGRVQVRRDATGFWMVRMPHGGAVGICSTWAEAIDTAERFASILASSVARRPGATHRAGAA